MVCASGVMQKNGFFKLWKVRKFEENKSLEVWRKQKFGSLKVWKLEDFRVWKFEVWRAKTIAKQTSNFQSFKFSNFRNFIFQVFKLSNVQIYIFQTFKLFLHLHIWMFAIFQILESENLKARKFEVWRAKTIVLRAGPQLLQGPSCRPLLLLGPSCHLGPTNATRPFVLFRAH